MYNIYTLEDLKHETYAYDKFQTIKNCEIPDYYKDVFPHKCECGAEMIMTEPDHTQLQCCNPGCYIKMAHKLAYFISSMGYKGFGTQSALSLFRAVHSELPFNCFLAVFRLSSTQLAAGLSDYYVGLLEEIREDLHERPVALTNVIAALGIQGIGPRSNFFGVVKSPVVLMQFAINNEMEKLCDYCGIQANITRFQLKAARADIVTLISEVTPNIMSTPKKEIFVAITGKVSVGGCAYTRMEFIDLCERIKDTDGVALFKLTETKAANKVDFVIADEPSNSEKYRLGERLHKLITADAFYNLLLSQQPKAEQKDSQEQHKEATIAEDGVAPEPLSGDGSESCTPAVAEKIVSNEQPADVNISSEVTPDITPERQIR